MHPHTVAVDLDGTLVENTWPTIGSWKPGAIQAMRDLNAAGIHIVLHTSRIAPVNPWGEERQPHEVYEEIARVRARLDEAGLTFIHIHTGAGKPGATVYVDDKAERYTGRPGSWRKLVPKLLARCKLPTSEFPPLLGEEGDG